MAIKTYTVGQNSGVRRLDELTGSWIDIPLNLFNCKNQPIDALLRDVMTDPNDPSKVFVVGHRSSNECEPGIYWSDDAGVSWNKALGDVADNLVTNPNGTSMIWEIWVTDSNTIYATSNYGYCFKSIDGGVTFDHTGSNPDIPGFPAPQNETFSKAIHFPTVNNGVVAVEASGVSANYVMITADGGASWTKTNVLTQGITSSILGIHMSDDFQTINVLSQKGIFLSTDGGTNYTAILDLSGSSEDLLHLTWTNEFNLWGYGILGYRVRSTDAGATWSVINPSSVGGPNQLGGHHYLLPDGFFSENYNILTTGDESVTGAFSETSPYGVTAVWTGTETFANCYLATNCEDAADTMLVTISPTEPPLDPALTYVFDIDLDKCWTVEPSDQCDNVQTISLNTGAIDDAGTLGLYDAQDIKWNVVGIPPNQYPNPILNVAPAPFPARVANQSWFGGYGSLTDAKWITVGQLNGTTTCPLNTPGCSPATYPHPTTGGYSVYELEFTPPPNFIPALALQFLIDNISPEITLNGNVLTQVPTGVQQWVDPVNVSTNNPAFFVNGVNKLQIVVQNAGTGSFGFNMAGAISNEAPPSTEVLVIDIFEDCDDCLTTCYQLIDCEALLDPIATDVDLSAILTSTIQIEGYPDKCWTITELANCPEVITPIVITEEFTNCEECLPKCYELIDCEGLLDAIQTSTDLALYVGDVIKISTCPQTCWLVSELETCPENTATVDVESSYVDCVTCLPEPQSAPELVIRNRTVNPGYDTPDCSPEYVEKISCNFAEAMFQKVASMKYGIEFCCNEDAEKWILKKELLNLKMITDPEACQSKADDCCPPCDVTATITSFNGISCPAPTNVTSNLTIE